MPLCSISPSSCSFESHTLSFSLRLMRRNVIPLSILLKNVGTSICMTWPRQGNDNSPSLCILSIPFTPCELLAQLLCDQPPGLPWYSQNPVRLLYKFSKIRSLINVTVYHTCGSEFLLFNSIVVWKFPLAFLYTLPHILKVDLGDLTVCVRQALKLMDSFI